MTYKLLPLAVALAIALEGCNANGIALPASRSAVSPSLASPKSPRQFFYVLDYDQSVLIYRINSSTPIGSVVAPSSELFASAVAVDPVSHVYYVASAIGCGCVGGAVIGYFPGTKRVVRTLKGPLWGSDDVVISSTGDLAVTNFTYPNGYRYPISNVVYYRHNDRTPIFSRTGGADGAFAAFDPAGNLYVAREKVIVEYTHDGKIVRSFPFVATNIAFDPQGHLYALNYFTGVLSVFAPNTSTPAYVLTKGVDMPANLAFDARGNLYVANCPACRSKSTNLGSIAVFAPGARSPSYVVSNGIENPGSAAFDEAGNLYVGNYGPIKGKSGGSVVVYAAGTSRILRTVTNGIHHVYQVAI